MPASSRISVSSLLVVADLEGDLQQHLRSHVPASRQWKVQSCSSSAEAAAIGPEEAPNLVLILCRQNGDVLCPDLLNLLDHAKLHWPYTFFILASARPLQSLEVLFERFGELPVVDLKDAAAVGRAVEREMANSISGVVRGVSLPGFLQMMEWEKKSLSIRVDSGKNWGRLHLLEGRLVNAYVHSTRQKGEAAALDIMSWDNVSLRIERSYHNREEGGMRALTFLLMDAMKKKDEDSKEAAQPEDFLLDDDPEENVLFRRPKSSTAGLRNPQPHSAEVPSPAPPELEPVRPTPVGAAFITSPPILTHQREQRENIMANVKETLTSALNDIDGAFAAALVDYSSGMALGMQGSGVNLEVAAAGNSDVVRAKMRTMESLGIKGEIEDILITLQNQYHIIYIVPNQPLFLYMALSKDKANLAMARYKLKALGSSIAIA